MLFTTEPTQLRWHLACCSPYGLACPLCLSPDMFLHALIRYTNFQLISGTSGTLHGH
ncbi:hypothetical protein C1645_772133 [Glomus cerebriforme]|uniref:Uncharacterized protein n=1 Tax=Glomus cerebriforme TaxID=658196 RepID=A0A397SZY4_9GLOM|nr:hypothetical protein C1645_772133 [Glomus cerebriforme]